MNNIIIGTRGSKLALAQAESVKQELEKIYSNINFSIEIIKTKGDKILDAPLSKIGDKGLFTKEIEEKLLDGSIHLAVHSMKDMPTMLPQGLCITAVTRRMDPSDAFISRDGRRLEEFTSQDTIATSSLRRKAQIKALLPGINVIDIRGNIITRLEKMNSDDRIGGIILARAGIERLSMHNVITQVLSPDIMLPPVGQAALAIETVEDNTELNSLLTVLNHHETAIAIQCERAFLSSLEGGCQVPIAGNATVRKDEIILKGLVADLDGSTILRNSVTGPVDHPVETGNKLARILLDAGGKKILDDIYASSSGKG